jgi:polysaccharide pyruvyl transferase WcaK-like protein
LLKPLSIVITHMSSDRNKGDLAILAATVAAFRGVTPGCSITAVSAELARVDGDPTETGFTRALGIDVLPTPVPSRRVFREGPIAWILRLLAAELALIAVHLGGPRVLPYLRPRDRSLFQCLFEAQMVVAKGGSYLYCRGGLRDGLYLWRMLYPLRAALAARRPLWMLGVSVGPLHAKLARALVARIMRRCRGVYVREEISLATCRDTLKVTAELIPDIAFLFDPESSGAPRDGAIGFTVREYDFPEAANPLEARRRYRSGVVGAIDEVLRRKPGLRVVFVPQVLDDIATGAALRAQLKQPELAQVLDTNLSPDELMTIYGSLDLVVATRLHSVILSVDAGTPPLHLVYEKEKGVGIMRRLGLEEWTMMAGLLNVDELTERILNLLARQDEIRAHIRTVTPPLRAEIRAIVANIVAAA